jgi:transcriptional regulator with XRE-family HTH domain
MKPSSFGTFIRAKRLEAGYTLRKFAETVDVSPTFLSRMERDEIEAPGESKIAAMAQALSIDAEELTLMAGRLPIKIREMIMQRPALVPLLRTANTKSDYDLQQLINSVIHNKTGE